MGNRFYERVKIFNSSTAGRETFPQPQFSSKNFLNGETLSYIFKEWRVVLFMWKKKIRNCGAETVNVHIYFVKVLRDASFSGNINFNTAIQSKGRFCQSTPKL